MTQDDVKLLESILLKKLKKAFINGKNTEQLDRLLLFVRSLSTNSLKEDDIHVPRSNV